MIMRPFRPIVIALCALAAFGGTARAGGDLVLQTADGPRHALVRPAGPGPHPTVIVLHGALGTGAETARGTGFAEAAARHGFTAVFPDGLKRHWHDGRAGGAPGPDDTGFLKALVARLIADRTALPGRIYLAGISNGGMMSFAMACKAGDLFAGIGTIIASMPDDIGACALSPVPLVMINGTADPMVPYAGGEVGLEGGTGQFGLTKARGVVWGAERTADLFARRDGCGGSNTTALPHRDPADRTRAARIDWNGCRAGASVTLYRIEGGGHALPGRPPWLPRLLGAANQDLDGAEAILSVFAGG
jgi:polyhydroxybutyrate depolymerase